MGYIRTYILFFKIFSEFKQEMFKTNYDKINKIPIYFS